MPFFVWCLLSAIWGSTWLFIRIGVQDLPPFGFAGIRFLITSIALWTALHLSKRKLPRNVREWRFILATGLVIISLQYGLIFPAEVYIPSGLTAVLYTIMSLCGMMYAHFLVPGEMMSLTKTFGVALGILGVGLVFSDQFQVSGRQAALACAAAILGGLLLTRWGFRTARLTTG